MLSMLGSSSRGVGSDKYYFGFFGLNFNQCSQTYGRIVAIDCECRWYSTEIMTNYVSSYSKYHRD